MQSLMEVYMKLPDSRGEMSGKVAKLEHALYGMNRLADSGCCSSVRNL